MRHSRVEAVLQEKREQHPELRTRPTWHAILQVLEREGVALRRCPIPGHYAILLQYRGGWTIALSTLAPAARNLYAVLHELGHLWLHHTQGSRWEPLFTMGYDVGRDDREDDADTFAAMILNPECWPEAEWR